MAPWKMLVAGMIGAAILGAGFGLGVGDWIAGTLFGFGAWLLTTAALSVIKRWVCL